MKRWLLYEDYFILVQQPPFKECFHLPLHIDERLEHLIADRDDL